VIDSPPGISSLLSQAGALLQRGELDQAVGCCLQILGSSPADPDATHLLGLARARLGQTDDAEQLLRRSIVLQPANHHYKVNFGNFLRRSGRLSEAETEFRQVLQSLPAERKARYDLALTLSELGRNPEAEIECRRLVRADDRDSDAWSLLGLVMNEQNRLFEAEVAYRRALDLTPGSALANHNLGSVLIRLDRAEEALSALDRAQSFGIPEFEVRFARGRALTLLYRLDEAEQEFGRAIALRPDHADAQANLARLRYMRSDPHFTRGLTEAIRAAPDNLPLQHLLCVVLFRAGRYDLAETRLREVLKSRGPLPHFRAALAWVLLELGQLKEAETEALEAAAALPRDSEVLDLVVSVLLSRGRPEDAWPFISAQRLREPNRQNWLAHEATAARLLGRPVYQDLYNYERFVRAWRPEPPPGWSTMRELNAAAAMALQARHRLTSHPLDQSLRNGSQTTRNLTADPDPAIRALLRSFEEPLRMYLGEIGNDSAHPFTARNHGAGNMSESWSVQLRRDGFHVNHLHPQGWISSAYYVTVPEEVSDTTLKSGWLKFGEPRHPVPGATPEHLIQPEAGLLVLFPSYMWHGTNPIHGTESRTTIAFDALPTR
jgi:Flp pilus assembly protein TadD